MNQLIIYAIGAGVGGVILGYIIRFLWQQKTQSRAQAKAQAIILEAKDEALKIKEKAKKEEEELKKELTDLERNIRRREDMIDKRLEMLDKERQDFTNKEKEVILARKEIDEIRSRARERLYKISHLTPDKAKELLFQQVEKDYKEDLMAKIKEAKDAVKEEAAIYSRKILSTVIERLATEVTAESTVSSVTLPNEEMKGRIIGKEGRNIQVFEKVTGVDVIIDDTPDVVTLSSFDPIRRYIATVAMQKLVADGRIQPVRIEEMVRKVEKEVAQEVKEAGENAAYEARVAGIHPDLIRVLGRLNFRTSYGQNVLRHSIEVAHIAGMLAAELGADEGICRKAGILHDIGKAVDHEVPGAHHHISMDIVRKYGLSETIINAVGAHHDDIEPKTVEAILVRAADAISGGRPGARRESLESYIKRLTELENIANAFAGVEKSFAIQAGREIRIIVKPLDIDDLQAVKLAKDIAVKIEKDLQYPGTIKVNVIRETRAVEYAK